MSVFRCGSCDQFIDGDYNGCHEDPLDNRSCICDMCLEEYVCERCGEIKGRTDLCYCESCNKKEEKK